MVTSSAASGDRLKARGALLLPLLSTSLALVPYLLTVAPDLTWAYHSADGAELITAACTLGVPHPPGYPTYVLLGRLLCALPLEPVARTFHLFSAVMAAASAGLVSALARYRVAPERYRPLGALAAGLFFAWLLPVWQQAVVAEIYTLNLALLAAFLWALLGDRPAWLSGLLLGLSLTTHLTSVFLMPLALYHLPRRQWATFGGGCALGLAPFLLLPLLARSDSPVLWGEPATPSGWWWLVSARLYRPNLFALPLARRGPRLLEWSRHLLPQIALALPLVLLASEARPTERRRPPGLAFLPSLLLYGLYAFTYNTDDSLVYLLPALLLLTVLLTRPFQQRPTLALFLPPVLLLLNFAMFEPPPSARELVMPLLEDAPAGAILLTDGDESTFSLWYLQSVEGRRPDVIIVDRNLLGFRWYRARLRRHDPALAGLEEYDLEQFRQANTRPICEVTRPRGDLRFVATEACQ